MQVKDNTIELAKYWAKTGSEILFDGTDPFLGSVSKEKLEENLYNEILRKLVDEETFELSEQEFNHCITLIKLN